MARVDEMSLDTAVREADEAIELSWVLGSVMKQVRVSSFSCLPSMVLEAEVWPGPQSRPGTAVVVLPTSRPGFPVPVPEIRPWVVTNAVRPVSVSTQLVFWYRLPLADVGV